MSEQTKEQPKVKLFREKSLEAIESPESLNDYLRVTSPGVWLILAAVITLLVGTILWGVFGHIRTTAQVAVEVKDGEALCYLPYAIAEKVMAQGSVGLDGKEYPLADEDAGFAIMEEGDPLRLLKAGNLSAGDFVMLVKVDTDLADGIYSATAVTEDLQPISLLLQ